MAGDKMPHIALLGNPNSGKSSLFNHLTGLRQKVGNFPGVTVEKKKGILSLADGQEVKITDLPGTYSLFPTSLDEWVVLDFITDVHSKDYPDAIICVADINQLERHMLLATQLADLNLPMIFVLNMMDIAEKEGLKVNVKQLQEKLGFTVVCISGRTGEGIGELKSAIVQLLKNPSKQERPFAGTAAELQIANDVCQYLKIENRFAGLLHAHYGHRFAHLSETQKDFVATLVKQYAFDSLSAQLEEIMARFKKITPLVASVVTKEKQAPKNLTERLDRVFTHPIIGPLIFMVSMVFVFQAIFSWSSYPMDAIESGFAFVAQGLSNVLPEAWWSRLIIEGLVAGLSGVLVFVPQIAVLFFLISLLEESGYMARVVYLFDHLMQRFGLNGRSVVALISGGACAIPAIMSTRTIGNWKERLITIMVTPLISCSARIPVFTILIAVTIPATKIWGFLNLQGLTFLGLYVLGVVAALVSAFVFKKIIKTEEQSFLLMELPAYQMPQLKNVVFIVLEKVKSFVFDAGKIILAVSLVLWFLASYGPEKEREIAAAKAVEMAAKHPETSLEKWQASYELESSYAGMMGKWIEPAIAPLGYDWKIGIALISSFAAREVFVGTMATIYAIGGADAEDHLASKMQNAVDPDTNQKVFTLPTSLSLMVFYLFAMQCMSTLAVVKRETKSWKWPAIQLAYMTLLAYVGSFIVYRIFL